MTETRFVPPTPEEIDAIRKVANRRLTLAEVQAALDTPWAEGEREEAIALLDWFARRYPTPSDRLAWARRAFRRWSSHVPAGTEAAAENAQPRAGSGR